VGQFVSPNALLLQQDGENWTRVAADARVRTAASLLSLPGYHSELKLDSGARLVLFGNLPDLLQWPILASQVTLHVPPTGFDADFTLGRGRVYVSAAKRAEPTKVRVRFFDEVWDLTLAPEQGEVMVELVTSYAGEPFRKDGQGESPLARVALGVLQGTAGVRAEAKAFELRAPPGPAGLAWDNKGGGLSKAPLEFGGLPPFWGKVPPRPLPIDRQREIDAALRNLRQRAAAPGKPIDLAVAEVAEDSSRSAQVLATLCQGALGLLPPLLDALEAPRAADVRLSAAYALQQYAARQPGNDGKVFAALQARKGYGEPQAEQALRLLHGFSEAALSDPATFDFLIQGLGGDQLGVRELSAWRLSQADPEGSARIRYNAADPEAARDRAIGEWRKRIPEGKLPPRTGPQGRLPAVPPPARG
jgi:hypothetical protein